MSRLVAGVGVATRRLLLEREAELAQIDGALDAAAAGTGQLVVVEAAPGLGKTSLLQAAIANARERGFDALSARGSELERDFPFGIVRQLLELRVASVGGEEREALFAGAAGLARPLFESEPVERPDWDVYPTLHGLYWLLFALADRRPLVLAVDDLQWADAPSLRFLAFFLARLQEVRAALLTAMRPPGPDAAMLVAHVAASPLAIAVNPRPLTPAATAALVACRLGQEAQPEFVEACHAATAGNPFFIEALLRELARQGLEPTDAHASRVRSLGPRAVSRAVVMRLARVRGGAALARAIAVLGDGAALAEAAPLAGLAEPEAATIADALVRDVILKRGNRLEFVHPIVRRAVYADLAPHERAQQHTCAARLLAERGAPSERVAAHLLQTDPVNDGWVVAALADAAHDALARGAPETAADYLRRAVAERPTHDDADLLHRLGAAEAQLGRPEALAHLEQALQTAGDGRTRALAAHDLALLRGLGGDAPRAVELFEEAIGLVAEDDRELALEFEAELAAVALFERGCARRVRARVERLQPQVTGRTIAERALLGQIALNEMMACAPVDHVAALAERALATPRWVVGRYPEAPQYFHAVAALVAAGRYETAAQHATQALEAGRTAGSQMTVAVSSYHRARLGYQRGTLLEAEADAEHGAELFRGQPWGAAQAGSLTTLVEILVERGALPAAECALGEHLFDEQIPDGMTFNFLLVARGALRLAQGRPADALDDLLEYGRREHDHYGANPALSSYRSRTARALTALGDRERARRLAEEELERARAFGAPRPIGVALCTCGIVEGEHGLGLLEEAVGVLEHSGAQVELARTLVELGSCLRRANRRAEARAPLSRGHELAQRCGADALAQQAATELQATGARPRRQLPSGIDALTPSERRIAAMAADGMSNPQIAQALFLSLKTVETHLGSAYRKLDIHSRSELPRFFAASQPPAVT